MKHQKTLKTVILAMLIALTAVGTMLVQIPAVVAHGYINFGDTFLMLPGMVLGPLAGFTAGAFGSALADVVTGYAYYAPITFVVKGLEGLLCGWIFKKLSQKYALAATLPAGILMMTGYFIGESLFLYGVAGAAASLFGNFLQGTVNALIAALLFRRTNQLYNGILRRSTKTM